MKRIFKFFFIALIVLLTLAIIAAATGIWHARTKLPQRSGTLLLQRLQATGSVDYDEHGVTYLPAGSGADLSRAPVDVHAQDR